jgi:hypothetical protein
MIFGQNSFADKAAHRFELIRQDHRAGQYLVSPPLFKSATAPDFLPLQAADILANIARAFVRNKFHGVDWPAQTQAILKRFVKTPNRVAFRRITRSQLEAAERNLTARLEQRKRARNSQQ